MYIVTEEERTFLINMILSLGCSIQLAEDIVQETYLEALETNDLSFDNLLNLCIKFYDKSKMNIKEVYISEWIFINPEDIIIEYENIQNIFQDIDELPFYYQGVLKLYYMGFSMSEIKKFLSYENLNVLKKRKERGIKKLKNIISRRKEAEYYDKRNKRKRK